MLKYLLLFASLWSTASFAKDPTPLKESDFACTITAQVEYARKSAEMHEASLLLIFGSSVPVIHKDLKDSLPKAVTGFIGYGIPDDNPAKSVIILSSVNYGIPSCKWITINADAWLNISADVKAARDASKNLENSKHLKELYARGIFSIGY
jgi:hypothetical protein